MKTSDRFDKLEKNIEKISDGVADINVTLAKQHASLDEHMRRTSALEESVDLLRKEVKPVQSHVAMMHGAAKLIGIISVAGGAIKVVLELFK